MISAICKKNKWCQMIESNKRIEKDEPVVKGFTKDMTYDLSLRKSPEMGAWYFPRTKRNTVWLESSERGK